MQTYGKVAHSMKKSILSLFKLLLVKIIFRILSIRDQFTCAYHCNELDEMCTNFADTLTTEDCKAITDNGQGLVKTSKLNQNAVRVWSNQEVQKGL